MSIFNAIDLKTYCNHKLVYEELPQTTQDEFGLDNICILQSDLKLKERELLDNVEFRFNFGSCDNIICERQRIRVDAKGSKLHIIGFAFWGDTNEYLRAVYDDCREQVLEVPFIDWSHKPLQNYESIHWYGQNVSSPRTVISSGKMIHLIYFHHTVCELETDRTVKEIVLPDNMFIHIFAMTLENEIKLPN